MWDGDVRREGAIVADPETRSVLAELRVGIAALKAGLLATAGNGEHSYPSALLLHTLDSLKVRERHVK
jgi:hypothetical protein